MKITKARLRQIIKEELGSIDVTAERKSDDMEEPIKQATENIIMEIEKLADVIGPFGARRAIVRAIAALKSKQEQYAVNEELEEIRTDGRGFAPSAIATYKDSDDHGEGRMARGQLGRIEELAGMIQNMVQDDSDLEEWVESKITKAQDYLSSVLNYMRGEQLSEGYYSKGKCVYKKDDNSKVGCTDGPVKDYLAALYANVDDAKEKK